MLLFKEETKWLRRKQPEPWPQCTVLNAVWIFIINFIGSNLKRACLKRDQILLGKQIHIQIALRLSAHRLPISVETQYARYEIEHILPMQ